MATGITITPDVIFGSEASYDLTGAEVPRVFLVEGLTSSMDIHLRAIAAVQQGGYNAGIYQAHPTQKNLFVSGYKTNIVGDQRSPSRTQIYVTVIYKTPDASLTAGYTQIEILSANGQDVLNTWPSGTQKGQPILVGYATGGDSFQAQIDPSSVNPDSDQIAGKFYDTVRIPWPSRNTIFRFTRLETGPPIAQQSFRSTVNQNAWNGYPANSVLCRAVDGVNIVGGGLIAPGMFRTLYELEYTPKPGGWTRVEFFRDVHTGKPPPDVVIDGSYNGYTIVTPPQMDFAGLKLPPLSGAALQVFGGGPLITSGGQ